MTDQEKITALTAALVHAQMAFDLLADFEAHEADTAKLIAKRESRRCGEQMVKILGAK